MMIDKKEEEEREEGRRGDRRKDGEVTGKKCDLFSKRWKESTFFPQVGKEVDFLSTAKSTNVPRTRERVKKLINLR